MLGLDTLLPRCMACIWADREASPATVVKGPLTIPRYVHEISETVGSILRALKRSSTAELNCATRRASLYMSCY